MLHLIERDMGADGWAWIDPDELEDEAQMRLAAERAMDGDAEG